MIELDRDNFEEEVIGCDLPTLVAFWRPGCGACSDVFPILKGLSGDLGERAKVGELNVIYAPEIAKKYKVPAVPTMIIFKNGEAKERAVGIRSKDILLERILSLID